MYGCDPITYFDVNDKKIYNLSCDCGEMEISAGRMVSNFIIVLKTKNGSFLVNVDSLKLAISPKELLDTLSFNYEGKKNTDGCVVLEKGESISINFSPQGKQNILILPNSYILCNNEPLITDTIKIRLK
jgi:hypothetical protein